MPRKLKCLANENSGIIDVRARYLTAARQLINTVLDARMSISSDC